MPFGFPPESMFTFTGIPTPPPGRPRGSRTRAERYTSVNTSQLIGSDLPHAGFGPTLHLPTNNPRGGGHSGGTVGPSSSTCSSARSSCRWVTSYFSLGSTHWDKSADGAEKNHRDWNRDASPQQYRLQHIVHHRDDDAPKRSLARSSGKRCSACNRAEGEVAIS
jgi:hypothetical protein